jgi:hypothetical protein
MNDEPTVDCRPFGKETCFREDLSRTEGGYCATSFELPLVYRRSLLDHLDEHFPCRLRGCYLMEKVDTGTFDSFLCLQSKRRRRQEQTPENYLLEEA